MLHSWGTRPIMEGNSVKGVFFESKSGRQAILAKVVIDSTGDGAALAVKAGIPPRHVDYKELQANLRRQGVGLPN